MKHLIFFLLLSLSPSAWAETKVTGNEMYLVHRSSSVTNMTDTAWANTSLNNTCVTGSTLTITTTGGDLFLNASGSYSNGTANQAIVISAVVNGSVIAGGLYGSNTFYVATVPMGFAFSYVYPIAAGTHWVCLTAATQGGNLSFPRQNATPANKARFSVMDLK